jgi:ABC-type spermidine/putrescine transport system permease subunit II
MNMQMYYISMYIYIYIPINIFIIASFYTLINGPDIHIVN